VYLLSQVTQQATPQQGSTKAEFLQLRQFFSYFSTPHIPFRSEIQVDYGGKILRSQWLSLRTSVYQDSQQEDNVACSEMSWETVKKEENNGITLSIYS
jgi:hypothetical protein